MLQVFLTQGSFWSSEWGSRPKLIKCGQFLKMLFQTLWSRNWIIPGWFDLHLAETTERGTEAKNAMQAHGTSCPIHAKMPGHEAKPSRSMSPVDTAEKKLWIIHPSHSINIQWPLFGPYVVYKWVSRAGPIYRAARSDLHTTPRMHRTERCCQGDARFRFRPHKAGPIIEEMDPRQFISTCARWNICLVQWSPLYSNL